MKSSIGVIAEDISDVAVVRELIYKIHPHIRFSLKSFVGRGSGKIRGKCFEWAEDLKRRGCSTLILLHDLDEYHLKELYNLLCKKLKNCSIPKNVVVIPIKEIEAWLLSDTLAIKKAFNLTGNVPAIANPQSLVDPKRKLSEIIYFRSGKTKRYVNSVDNQKIAAEIDLSKLRKCSSYKPLEYFVQNYIQ